jgi:hypothetical protein
MAWVKTSTRYAKARRGVSYLEVLIAAGIGVTGLLGAIAIFPIAIANLQRGVVSDTAAAVGPSGLEQAYAVGALNRSNWMGYSSGAWQPGAAQAIANYPAPPLSGSSVGPWASVCIDPRFCAEVDTSNIPGGTSPGLFPYYSPGSPNEARMHRITLPSGMGTAMSTAQARLLFKCSDDLLFEKASDNLGPLPARQFYIEGQGGTPVRRDYYGEFEWMVTLTPKMTGVMTDSSGNDSNGNPAGIPFENTREYRASVVVFHQRPPRLDTIDQGDATHAATERVVNVTNFYGQGFNGGEVRIEATNAIDLAIRGGDWVMLSGVQRTNGRMQAPLFNWYRVAAVHGEAFDLGGGQYERFVTLEGGDWPVNAVQQTQMTIVSGAVGVFEQMVIVQD